jgi:hypothetical protein
VTALGRGRPAMALHGRRRRKLSKSEIKTIFKKKKHLFYAFMFEC